MFDRHYSVWPENFPHSLRLPETCLYTNLAITAQRYPSHNAIIYYDTPITYRELKEDVDALAGYLMAQGVQRGDRVLLFMQNAPQFIVSFYAILRANAIVVPINPMNRSAELEHYLDDTGAEIAIAGQEVFASLAPKVGTHALKQVVLAAYNDYILQPTDLELPPEVAQPAQLLAQEGVVLWKEALQQQLVPGPLLVGPKDYAVFPYSSGTTGAPKGCMHTHRSVMASCVQGSLWTHGTSESVILSTLPYFHVTGMQGSMNSPIYSGSTIVLMTRWNRNVAATLIERYRISRWVNIVTMAIDLLSDPEIESYDLSSLENIGGGGAAMPKAISDKLMSITGLRYMEGYGLSETMAGTHINPTDRPKTQCLGIPVFDVDSRIYDADTNRLLDVGEVGEIIINAPQVFVGYWNLPEATAEAFIEIEGKRFFRTGDMGYYDEEGYFFIVDRLKRMVNASGFKVWPAEVEGILHAHPEVKQACVISTPHSRRGESVKACIVLSPTASAGNNPVTAEDIIAWSRGQMAAYKVPEVVEFMEALPLSPTGKVMWRQLQEQEWDSIN